MGHGFRERGWREELCAQYVRESPENVIFNFGRARVYMPAVFNDPGGVLIFSCGRVALALSFVGAYIFVRIFSSALPAYHPPPVLGLLI